MSTNPDLRLSEEKGYEDKNREDQIAGRDAYDWRDWLNYIEFKTLSVAAGQALAKSRFDNIKVQPDIPAALIAFKLSVMQASVSHEFP